MTASKIAVTVPPDTLMAVERRRRVLGLSRSAVVTAALESWLAEQSMTAEERKYLLAYLRHPETSAEIRETSALAKAAVSTWEPWDSPSPAPKRKGARRGR
jgi:hypothetical protein